MFYHDYYTLLEKLVSNAKRYIIQTPDGILELKHCNSKTIEDHLRGTFRLGIFPDTEDGLCQFGTVDVDMNKELDAGTLSLKDVFDIGLIVDSGLKALGFSPVIELSKSSKTHVWIFFQKPVDRANLQKLLMKVVERTGVKVANGSIEVFPKSQKGNGIFLPYFNAFKIVNDKPEYNPEFGRGLLKSAFVDVDSRLRKDITEVFDEYKFRNNEAFSIARQFEELPRCFTNAALNWKSGDRNSLLLGLAGVCKKQLKLDKDEALDVMSNLVSSTGDEEYQNRMQNVLRTYEDVDNVAACSILQGKHETLAVSESVCDPNCKFYRQEVDMTTLDPLDPKAPPTLYADIILQTFNIVSQGAKGLMWIYSPNEECKGIWVPDGDRIIGHYLETGDLLPQNKRRTSFIRDVKDCIRRKTDSIALYKSLAITDALPLEDPNFIAFRNGVYDLRTEKFMPFSPNMHLRSKLPWNYNPEARMHNLDKLLGTFTHPDRKIDLMELMAICLWKRNIDAQYLWFLKGGGSNGKSFFMSILERLFSGKNITSLSLNQIMEDKFMRGSLRGKYLNNGGEITVNSIVKNTEVLKSLSAGDTVSADIKFGDLFTFNNTAKLVFSCNRMLEARDNSDGWYRRLFIIEFPHKYCRSTSSAIQLEAIMDEEYEALAYSSLLTLKAIVARGFQFTNNPTDESVRALVEKENNRLHEFIKTKCIQTDDTADFIEKEVFNEEFIMWLGSSGLHSKYNHITITQELTKQFELVSSRKAIKKYDPSNNCVTTERKNVWLGIKWKDGKYNSKETSDLNTNSVQSNLLPENMDNSLDI